MPTANSRRLLKSLLIATACVAAWPAHSMVIRVNYTPRPLIWLTIGSFGSAVDEVSFNIPSGQLGNGNAINGNPRIRVLVASRAGRRFSRAAVLTADSSTPLTNGSATLPFTNISWQSRFGNMPSGRYDGSNNQLLWSLPRTGIAIDFLRFRYDNTSLLESGSYRGRVVYTLSMP